MKTLGVAGARKIAAALSLCFGFSAFAQGSVLTGTVEDAATKAPVADIVVTATSPGLQGEQVVVSDATGTYRIPQLPPGTYSLRFEKEGYKPFTRNDVVLRLDQTLRFNLEILPEALQATEEIVVVSGPPTIDVGSGQLGTSINQDFIHQVPIVPPSAKNGGSRSFEALAEVAPTGQADRYGYSLNGATSNENAFLIDGLSVSDPAYGTIGSALTLDFIQEVNVISGGYLPEYGRSTGGLFDVVTKSGSNEFHGSVFSYFSPGAFNGSPSTIGREANAITTTTRTYFIGSLGAELGGPIQKDKLWFYAGFAPSFARYQLERNLNVIQFNGANPVRDSNGQMVTSKIDGTQQNYFADQHSYQYIGKLTYLLNRDHNVTVSVHGTPTSSGGNNALGIDPNTGQVETNLLDGQIGALAHRYLFNSNNAALKWSSSFNDKRILFDATLGWHHQFTAVRAMDDSRAGSTTGLASLSDVWWSSGAHSITEFENLPDSQRGVCDSTGLASLRCPVASYNTGGPRGPYWPLGIPISEASLDRYQARFVGTYFGSALGHHIVKAGFDVERLGYQKDKAVPGTVQYTEAGPDPANPGAYLIADYRQFGYLTGPDNPLIQRVVSGNTHSTGLGAFLQDSWSIMDEIALNAGVRYDLQSLQGSDGRIGIYLPNEWSPRIGLVYDFTKAGRSKLFASYARYYESIPLNMVDRSFPGDRFLSSVRSSVNCNLMDPVQASGSCRDPANLLAIAPGNDPNQRWGGFNQDTIPVDPNIKPQSNDEVVAGGEYEVIRGGRAGLSWTHRNLNYVIEDMSRDEGFTYFIGNPGYGIASIFPKGVRKYDAVTVYFSKAFSQQWLTQASFTWSTLRGNHSGLFRPENNQLEPNLTSDFDLLSLIANRQGALPADHRQTWKFFGAKVFDLTSDTNVTLGFSYIGRSGAPLNYLGGHYLYGPSEAFILPRGAAGRLPWVHSIDALLGLSYKLTRQYTLTMGADIFNLFNFQAATSVDQNYTFGTVRPVDGGSPRDLNTCDAADPAARTDCKLLNGDGTAFSGNKNPNFLRPTSYQASRSFRFTARLSF